MGETYLTIKELCCRWDISRKKLWTMRKAGIGPVYRKDGGSIRYMMHDVLKYEIESGIQATDSMIDIDPTDLHWLAQSSLNIQNNFLYMVLYAVVYLMKTKGLGTTEYLCYKQIAILFRDRLFISLPNLRNVFKKICDDI